MVDVRPDPKPERTTKPKRRTDDMRRAALLFKEIVCADGCFLDSAGGNECEYPLQAAHVVPKQTLYRRGLGHLVYDPVNAICLCYRHHRRHDSGVEKIPRHWLPGRCMAWADAHGVTDALERRWPA